jgi:hypothetical protein
MVIRKGFLGWGFFYPNNEITAEAEAVSRALQGPVFFDQYWEAKGYAEARGLEVRLDGSVTQPAPLKMAA